MISNIAKKECVIGLDISTSCTGISVLSLDGQVIDLSYYKPKGDTLVEKANSLRVFLNSFVLKTCEKNKVKISEVYIEQNLQRFRRGFSSANVINTLARFNGMISYVAFEDMKVQPRYVNVNEGRKSLGIKIPRGSDTKEEIRAWCEKKYPNIRWPEKTLKSGPRKGLVILDPCCYDMADALVTAAAGLKLHDNIR